MSWEPQIFIPTRPLLALVIKVNPTLEKRDNSAVGLSLMYIIIVLVNGQNKFMRRARFLARKVTNHDDMQLFQTNFTVIST